MKSLLIIIYWLSPTICISQTRDSIFHTPVPGPKAEIFTNGFIDIMNNGQLSASARFIRLLIGEPGNFAVPLSLYSGVSANSFQNFLVPGQISNEGLVNSFINPLSGLINVSSDGLIFFKKTVRITKTGMLYHFGERILTGFRTGFITDPGNGKPTNFPNSFAAAGLYFQTGAWERTNAKTIGLFWLVARYHLCYSNPAQIRGFLPAINTNGVYSGYSLGAGVEITNLVNIKLIYYKYIKRPEIDYSLPIYQFSFNYSMH